MGKREPKNPLLMNPLSAAQNGIRAKVLQKYGRERYRRPFSAPLRKEARSVLSVLGLGNNKVLVQKLIQRVCIVPDDIFSTLSFASGEMEAAGFRTNKGMHIFVPERSLRRPETIELLNHEFVHILGGNEVAAYAFTFQDLFVNRLNPFAQSNFLTGSYESKKIKDLEFGPFFPVKNYKAEAILGLRSALVAVRLKMEWGQKCSKSFLARLVTENPTTWTEILEIRKRAISTRS
ncbi:MAG: hypothetical protein NTZ73_04435 [Candidatus Diapherotrites archaeon]|nr:hypothetical protein [Candidatus Diapherotrites archaeon]